MNAKLFILGSLLFLSGFILKTTKERLDYQDYFTFSDEIFKVGLRMTIKVNYDFDKSGIRPESKKLLDSVYLFMLLHPELTFEVANHTDSRGNDRYNLKLSENRAKSVRNYLLSKGIPAERLTARGAGETELIYKDEQIENGGVTKEQIERCHQTNRRTVLTITGMDYKYPEGTEQFTVGNFVFFNKETLHLVFGENSSFCVNDNFSKAVVTYGFNEAILKPDHPYRINDKVFTYYKNEDCHFIAIVILSRLPNTKPQFIDSKENREVYQYDLCSDKWIKLDI